MALRMDTLPLRFQTEKGKREETPGLQNARGPVNEILENKECH